MGKQWGVLFLQWGFFQFFIYSAFAEDLPWEIKSHQSETLVSDYLYADPYQNRQIAPTDLTLMNQYGDLFSYQVDRLIYPTLGNPNLFTRTTGDTLDVVLRLEKDWLRALITVPEAAAVDTAVASRNVEEVQLLDTESDHLRFYLVPRESRRYAERAEAVPADLKYLRIIPTQVNIVSEYRQPQVFNNRYTVRVVFDESALSQLKEGLYDIRMELVALDMAITHEFHYNAVRIFDHPPQADEYPFLAIADTQVSVNQDFEKILGGKSFKSVSVDRFRELVSYINRSDDPTIRDAAFVSFNGDLHNGGAPTSLGIEQVAETYQDEAKASVTSLRELNYPIFLTPGNHDGYVSTGHFPDGVEALPSKSGLWKDYKQFIKETNPLEADKVWDRFSRYLSKTWNQIEGLHVDLFSGRFMRPGAASSFSDWKSIPEDKENVILYDGFNQWQRTYGPLNLSWNYGKNHFVSVNSYDLRQHRRSGWGMYIINYGGAISPFQMNWLKRDTDQAKALDQDIVMLLHHDPRGGNRSQNMAYYYAQDNYASVYQSGWRWVFGKTLKPFVCKWVPEWMKDTRDNIDCQAVGGQEWMRPDEDFDCEDQYKTNGGRYLADRCDAKRFWPLKQNKQRLHYNHSGFEFIDLVAKNSNIRTLMFGHDHIATVEMYQPTSPLIPKRVRLSGADNSVVRAIDKKQKSWRIWDWLPFNETAGFAVAKDPFKISPTGLSEEWVKSLYQTPALPPATSPGSARFGFQQGNYQSFEIPQEGEIRGIERDFDLSYHGYQLLGKDWFLDLEAAGYDIQRSKPDAELAILRIPTASELTDQKTENGVDPMYGFTLIQVSRNAAHSSTLPQVNHIDYYRNTKSDFSFVKVESLGLDRMAEWRVTDTNSFKNPLADVLEFKSNLNSPTPMLPGVLLPDMPSLPQP